MPTAIGVAEKLLAKFSVKIGSLALIPSSGGVFEVIIDENLLFSKKELGRFPEEGELADMIDKLV